VPVNMKKNDTAPDGMSTHSYVANSIKLCQVIIVNEDRITVKRPLISLLKPSTGKSRFRPAALTSAI
jgi:hypothetical protein